MNSVLPVRTSVRPSVRPSVILRIGSLLYLISCMTLLDDNTNRLKEPNFSGKILFAQIWTTTVQMAPKNGNCGYFVKILTLVLAKSNTRKNAKVMIKKHNEIFTYYYIFTYLQFYFFSFNDLK